MAANAWAARAAELAEWTDRLLVNRRDCRGGYRPESEVGREYTLPDGTVKRLGSQTTRKDPLTVPILARHYAPRWRADIMGLHSTGPHNLSRWGALDIDVHDGSIVSPHVTQAAAINWFEVLRRRGFRPLLTSSNGKGGCHLRFILNAPAPTADVYHYLRQLVSDYRLHGLTAPPEHFPKQAGIEPGRYGNWLRLPGKHHSREFWSEVWDGDRWLSGGDAVAFLLALDGDSPNLIPKAPPHAPPSVLVSPPRNGPPSEDELARRIRGRIARLPHLSAGQGRDRVAFNFSAWLRRDLNLSPEQALLWLLIWDAGNNPPLGEEALAEISDNAYRYGKGGIGSALAGPPVRFGRRRGRISSMTFTARG